MNKKMKIGLFKQSGMMEVLLFVFIALTSLSVSALPEEIFAGSSLRDYQQLEKKYSDDQSEQGKLAYAIILHNKSMFLENPAEDIQKAKELLEVIDQPLAVGYLGSVITLESSDAINKNKVLKALRLLNEGCSLIDKAVKMAPDDAIIRRLRLENSINLTESSPLNRYSEAWEDAQWLLSDPDQADSPDVCLLAGKAALGMEEYTAAFELLEKVIRLAPRSEMAEEADMILFELEE